MPDVALLDIAGARPEKANKYTSLATLKFIGGLQTQRSAFMSIDTRYNSRYLGGKPDALIAGSNVELSNRLTLTRRPGLVAYSTAAIPAPDFFFSWQQADTANFIAEVDPTGSIYPQGNLQLIIDTASSVYNYSPTYAGILFNKAPLSGQTSFNTVSSTMYMGDGVDLYKDTGANLLSYSNTFTNAIWSHLGTTSITAGQTDPTGTLNATAVVFSSSGSSATSYLLQHVSQVTLGGGQLSTPLNYTPVSNNTFTFSVWMKSSNNGDTIFLQMTDSTGAVVVNTQQTLTTSWKLYQVTGMASNGATYITVLINDPSSSVHTYYLYGAQLEVGGPATPTVITTTKPLGIYLWGITAPTTAPTFTTTSQSGSTGQPWQANHAYGATTYSLSSVEASAALSSPVTTGGVTYTTGAVYHGIIGASASSLIGQYFSVTGFTNASNNTAQDGTHPGTVSPGFVCVGNNGSTTLTLANLGAVAETHSATATELETIIDSNGNLEVVYTPGTSGGTQPQWMPVQGQLTPDGLSNLIVQSVTPQTFTSTGGSITFTVTNSGDTVLVFIFEETTGSPATTIVGSQGHTYTLAHSNTGRRNVGMFLYYNISDLTAGTETITFSSGGTESTWMAIVETVQMTGGLDGSAAGLVTSDTSSIIFNTGAVSTTNQPNDDMLVSFAGFISTKSGFDIGSPPTNPAYQVMASQADTTVAAGSNTYYWNIKAAATAVALNASYNPEWSITNPSNGTFNVQSGITAAFKSSVGTLQWYNLGQTPVTGLSPKTGYTWYYAFVNTYTGHRSNVSPLSSNSGPQTGVVFNLSGMGAAITQSGTGAGVKNVNPLLPGSGDPQVDAIELYRNVDGGGFWYQVPAKALQAVVGQTATFITGADGNIYIANPGTTTSPGTFTVVDGVPDSQLNTQIFAPVGFLNSVPPVGLKNLEFFAGRLWGSVGATLYYATGADDATLINVIENGVSAESWEPTNFIPFNSPIVRSVAVGAGLVVFTTTDVWIIAGSNLASFQPIRVLNNIGLGNYNGLCVDGSNVIFFTRDRQCLQFNVNAAASEIGFLIGDLLESQMNPLTCYLARHVKGSQDNAFYFGDGSTGWFRMNPNQYGASVNGEQTSLWSPFASITNGAGAIASIEVQPGIKLLLIGNKNGINIAPGPSLGSGTITGNADAYALIGAIAAFTTSGLGSPQRRAQFTNFTSSTSNHPTSVTIPYTAQPGDLVVCMLGCAQSDTLGCSTDSGDTMLSISNHGSGLNPNAAAAMFYAANVKGSGTMTITATGAAFVLMGAVVVYSNCGTSVSVAHSDSVSAATNISAGPVTVPTTGFTIQFAVDQGNGMASNTFSPTSWNQLIELAIGTAGSPMPGNSGVNGGIFLAAADSGAGGVNTGVSPIFNRDITVFTDAGLSYSWNATIGSIMLALPGKLAEIESITTEMNLGIASPISTQCGVGVIIDEIAGPFETLTYIANDPPQLANSVTILSKRFYLSEGTIPPVGRHMQIQLTGAALSTEDELLAITIRGCLIEEQS